MYLFSCTSHIGLVSNPLTTCFAALKPFQPIAAVYLVWGGIHVLSTSVGTAGPPNP